jgi:hypothetical protein
VTIFTYALTHQAQVPTQKKKSSFEIYFQTQCPHALQAEQRILIENFKTRCERLQM